MKPYFATPEQIDSFKAEQSSSCWLTDALIASMFQPTSSCSLSIPSHVDEL